MIFNTLETKNNVFVAPIAGVTDHVFRKILKDMGAGLLYTEMVSAKALCFGDKKTKSLMQIADDQQPCGVQLFGSDPKIIAEAAKIVENTTPAAFIDINMGCPVPKVAGNGEGSALLKNPPLMGEIIYAVKNAVKLPVTAKIRIGWTADSINAVECAKILEQNGADMIAVHGRTREQYYSGTADRSIIRDVKNAVKIPVVGNGDITSPESMRDMFEFTGCDAVMLARGIMGNPWLIKQCLHYQQTGEILPQPSFDEMAEMAVYHTKMLVEAFGERNGIRQARGHLTWYVKGRRGAAAVKNLLTSALTVEEIEEVFARWKNELSDTQH